MYWLFLIIGIVLEVTGTLCMKLSHGFTRLVPSILMFVFWGAGFGFLTIALKKIDVSVAYTIWAGTGIAAMATIGMIAFAEHVSVAKVVSIGLVVLGVVGLNLAGGGHDAAPAGETDSAADPEGDPGPGSRAPGQGATHHVWTRGAGSHPADRGDDAVGGDGLDDGAASASPTEGDEPLREAR